MPEENKLQVIVKESGLDTTKAKFLLENFQDYFEIAAEWEAKAKTIIVTNAGQKAEMQMARAGRLFLREKRIAIENARKKLKEQSLREGKAIDGIANVLKAVIVPLEEYLDKQEHFVEIKAKEEADRIAAEMLRKADEERIAKEKDEEEKREKEAERIRQENEKLREQAEKERKEREAIEAKVRKEKEEQEKILAKERAKQEAEQKALQEKARKEKEALEAKMKAERIKAEEERRLLLEMIESEIECPHCHGKFMLKNTITAAVI